MLTVFELSPGESIYDNVVSRGEVNGEAGTVSEGD